MRVVSREGAWPVPARRVRVEDVVRGSRFLTTLDRADDEDAARAVIDAVRAEFPDATHHCWAYVLGPPGSTERAGASDAGEPSGTAGKPMLHALLHGGVGDVVVVVTRWFGGTKLGRGGLVRAYGGAVLHALREAPVTMRVRTVPFEVVTSFADLDGVRRVLETHGATVDHVDWADVARISGRAPGATRDELERAVADASHGRAQMTWKNDAPESNDA